MTQTPPDHADHRRPASDAAPAAPAPAKSPAAPAATPDAPRVVVAPDSFKGTFTAAAAAEAVAAGIAEELPAAALTVAPMADGGEGTAACFAGDTVTLPTVDAAGRLTEASYIYDAAQATAYIDVAAASGLPAVADQPVPLTGDTFGTGVLIADAAAKGARRVVLALGGSATVDGGSGILVALGARLLDRRGLPVPKGGGWLTAVDSVDTAQLNTDAAGLEFLLLTDVESPACGPEGAAAVFGPQKGAAADDVRLLDEGLAHLCELFEVDPATPGTGAAGGVPVSLAWLSRLIGGPGARVLPGAPVVAAALDLKSAVAEADLVVTGEGRLDEQSFTGKVVGHVAGLADKTGTRLGVVCGAVAGQADHRLPAGSLLEVLDAAADGPGPAGGAGADALRAAGRALARDYLETSTVQG